MKKIIVILALVMTFVSNCFGQVFEDFDRTKIANWGWEINDTTYMSYQQTCLDGGFGINFLGNTNNIIINIPLNNLNDYTIKVIYNCYNCNSVTINMNDIIQNKSKINSNCDSMLFNINYIDTLKINVAINYAFGISKIELIANPTSLSKPTEITSLVYPNPTRGLITIKMDSYDTYSVKLIDPLGRILQTSDFKGMESVVDVSSQIDGFYLLQITDSKGQVSNKKFSISK